MSPISSSDKELYKQFPLVNDLDQINKSCILADLQLAKKYLPKLFTKNYSVMWSQKIYILFLTKITKKKHTILFLESTNLFTIYSYETSLNVLSRFSLKSFFWKGSFLTNFHLFHQWTAFFYLLRDKIWYLSGPVSKHHLNFFELFFHWKYQIEWLRIPQIMDIAARKAFQSIELSHFTFKDLSLKLNKDHLRVKVTLHQV